MTLNREKSPMSAIVGYALLLNLITGPFLTVLFYGTTLDEQVFKYCRSNVAKNLWRMTSLLTCWIVLVAEEAFSIYERFKLSEKVRKMLKRPSIFRKVSNFASVITIGVSDPGKNQNNTNQIGHKDPGNKKNIGSFDKLTENRRSLLKNYYSMIEKDIDRLNNLCARESSIQLVLQFGCKTAVVTFLSNLFFIKFTKILFNQSSACSHCSSIFQFSSVRIYF